MSREGRFYDANRAKSILSSELDSLDRDEVTIGSWRIAEKAATTSADLGNKLRSLNWANCVVSMRISKANPKQMSARAVYPAPFSGMEQDAAIRAQSRAIVFNRAPRSRRLRVP